MRCVIESSFALSALAHAPSTAAQPGSKPRMLPYHATAVRGERRFFGRVLLIR
jgi:hypothetical protein